MANEYCRHLSNGFRFLYNNLVYQPCCWVPESPPVNSLDDLNRYRTAITNSVMANKEKYCQDCIKREQSGSNDSIRQHGLNQIPSTSEDGDVVDLSIQIDTNCNAACSTCGPNFSSLWRKELTPGVKLENTEESYWKLTNIIKLDKLLYLRFYGGEPLVNDNHLILLNAVPHPENVTIQYSTNGSIFPNDTTLKLWSKFKSVSVTFSIDDMNDRFHYIRWPLMWNKVKNNIEQFNNIPAVKRIGINCTVNPMNVLYLDQLESWYNELRKTSLKYHKLNFSACYGTWGIDAAPEKLRNQVIEKYGQQHEIAKLLKSFPMISGKWEQLLDHMDVLDISRKLSHKDTFAEVLSIVNNQ